MVSENDEFCPVEDLGDDSRYDPKPAELGNNDIPRFSDYSQMRKNVMLCKSYFNKVKLTTLS